MLLRRKPTAPGEALDLCLADFGCSQYVDRSGRASSSPGTPLFAAPEVMFKRNGLEADLWSAGVLVRGGYQRSCCVHAYRQATRWGATAAVGLVCHVMP